jgi:hypothetical protein
LEVALASEFRFSEEEYLALLELTYEVAQSIQGKVSIDGRKPDSQYLALKLYAHAATAYWLYQGTKAPVPASTGGSSFIDFSSIAVITRAAIETYLSFFEVFVATLTDDEFEFNYCLWHLSGNIFFEKLGSVDSSLEENYKAKEEEIAELRDRLKKTARFAGLKSGEQKDVLDGKRKRDWAAVAKSAGFGFEFLRKRVYPYSSGFVHADGYAAGQMMSAQTNEDQKFHAEMNLVTMMILLSKFILDYESLFEEVQSVTQKFESARKKAEIWSEVARRFD